MSTYSEIYSTKLRNQSMILNGEKTQSPSSRYVTLIKNIAKKRKSSSESKTKFKPRRINAKSAQNHTLDKSLTKKPKKKTISKQKLEKNQKQKKQKENEVNNNRNEINKNIKNRMKKYLSQSNVFKKDILACNKKLENITEYENEKESEVMKQLLSDTTIYNSNRYNNNNINIYNTLQNNNNNYPNCVKLSKTSYNENPFKKFFDVYKLRRDAANFRDIMMHSLRNDNNRTNYNLRSINDINRDNRYLNTISDFRPPKKSKTYFEAKKLKEEIETIDKINDNRNIFPNYVGHRSNTLNQEKFFSGEMADIKNNNNKNEMNKENYNYNNNNNNEDIISNINDKKNDNGNDNDNKDLHNITYHFFDKNIKMPKRMKKYMQNNSNKNKSMNAISNNINSFINNNFDLPENNYKNQHVKNRFRKEAKTIFNGSTNYTSIKNELNNNKLTKYFSPNSNRNIHKKDRKNIDFNLITQENVKLANLLKKIPSNREFRDKSINLINYILDLRRYKSKNKFLNATIFDNGCQSIYPANECNIISDIHNNYFN